MYDILHFFFNCNLVTIDGGAIVFTSTRIVSYSASQASEISTTAKVILAPDAKKNSTYLAYQVAPHPKINASCPFPCTQAR